MGVDGLAGTVSVEEAAAALGISGQTVRRYIKRGQLHGQLVIGPKGKEWRVRLEGTENLPVVQESNSVEEFPGLLELAQLLREMHNSWQRVTTENGELREERAQLRIEVERLREKVVAMEVQQELRPSNRMWWQFWKH